MSTYVFDALVYRHKFVPICKGKYIRPKNDLKIQIHAMTFCLMNYLTWQQLHIVLKIKRKLEILLIALNYFVIVLQAMIFVSFEFQALWIVFICSFVMRICPQIRITWRFLLLRSCSGRSRSLLKFLLLLSWVGWFLVKAHSLELLFLWKLSTSHRLPLLGENLTMNSRRSST